MIRNILMGEQMENYESKFSDLEQRIATMEKTLISKIGSVEENSKSGMGSIERDMNNNFQKLEKMLQDGLSNLDKKLDKVSTADKMKLGKMLEKVSKQLMGQ